MEEVWEDIPNYEGYYQASTFGRIRSLNRLVNSGRGGIRMVNGRILKPRISNRYFMVNLYIDGIEKTYPVHKLVAMTFLNHTPCGHDLVVDHIDNDPTNNHVSNLQETTQRYNSSKDKSGTTSVYTGVYWDSKKNKWKAFIRLDGVKKYLGSFDCELSASKAYQDKLKEIQCAQ